MIRTTTQLLAVFCFIFTSCSTDIEINDPALQTKIDGEIFRSSIKSAVIYEDGTLVISGTAGEKSISFSTSATQVGSYKTSQQTVQKVSFKKDQEEFNSAEGETEGTVTITEIHNNEISGTFFFNNLKDENGNTTNFSDGWFYKIPLENGVTEEEVIRNNTNPCLLNASLTALVNGSEMITDDHSAEVFGVENVSIIIKATNQEGEISIVFPSNASTGNYSLTGSGDYSATYTALNDKSSARSGTLTITSHDTVTKCISGSFEFETRSGVQISEGLFEFGY
ncbi:DUF6252 family protein [Aquimarina mytili]|uniref:Lipoprotein n=1 Tax=Aquimarina mytili TaxID=874423 RepID=A0A937D4F9_9FLAO|nr:DUF6252 family protein [Aquimarina mytili]MBL0682149.1 hypothetical protein [Aquimarina mytili]